MGVTETSSEDADRQVPIAMFGERGMDHCPKPKARAPLAAGLFGVTAERAADWRGGDFTKGFGRALLA